MVRVCVILRFFRRVGLGRSGREIAGSVRHGAHRGVLLCFAGRADAFDWGWASDVLAG